MPPRAVDEALERIHAWLQSGQSEPAEQCCRQLLEQSPNVPAAWFYLGRIALMRLDLPTASAHLERAIALDGGQAIFHGDLSVAQCEQRRPAEAELSARRAIELTPQQASFWLSLGNALFRQERWEEAAAAFRQSASLDASLASAWNNLGSAEHCLGRLTEAAVAYERCLAIVPEAWDTLRSYAAILNRLGNPQHAEELLERVIAQLPQHGLAWLDLGNARLLLGRFAEAEEALRRALALQPANRDALSSLAQVLLQQWRLREAEVIAREILNEDAKSADAWRLLGQILHSGGRAGEAVAAFEQSRLLRPGPLSDSIALLTSQYSESVTRDTLLKSHRQWDANHAQHLRPPQPPAITSATGRKLRLGFVSADFGRHPIGYLTASVLEHLDPSECDVVCYSDRTQEDEITARFRQTATVWRQTAGVADERLAGQIQQDEIDILFDMAGHTGNRLQLFARRPAPLQISWLGYVGTTGLAAMDYLLADRFHVPVGEEADYVEQILRMPNCYVCYAPPDDAPPVSELPAFLQGHCTFGCFNNVRKYSASQLDAWAAILRQVPSAQLLLKYGGLEQPAFQDSLKSHFADRGVVPARIQFEGWSSHADLLAAYNRVDLALDTQPYSGGLTTCEALWMGVPVITFPGQTFAGRHATSILSNAGYEQFVAADRDSFVELAVRWSQRLPELAAIRAGLRERLQQSPVCDARSFARDLLSLLRQTWAARAQ